MGESRIIHGFHAVIGRIRQNAESVFEVYVDSQRRDPRARDLLKLAETNGVRIVPVDGKRLDGMVGNTRHQGVAARVDAAQRVQHLDDVLDTLTEPAMLLVLDGVQDPHNLGACLRSADAFGVHAVIAPKDRAVGINATVEKVACGAAET
ncbi:MAG: RNA methyltransferase substrate-binding domain-containing protein, partial [Gallionellaceae bacterium]|nr:RNA methyltransferase substrate-binding domain-containing protein [Gallionellaceae bacterium]